MTEPVGSLLKFRLYTIMQPDQIDIEVHPWQPFVPHHARVLIMGTFPPQPKRWSMDFYYPNRNNDFWPMMGLLFYNDRDALRMTGSRDFNVDAIRRLLEEKGIAMNDTARKARRLMGNASDKFLEIVEPVPLYDLLALMPECRTIATTGEKAASIIAEITSTDIPKMGEYVTTGDGIDVWRMPSTSRAYPMKLEKKAEYYGRMLKNAGVDIRFEV